MIKFQIIAASLLFASTGLALAADNGVNEAAPGQNKALLELFYGTTGSPTPGGTVGNNLGQAISGGFYGNTSNAGTSPYAPANLHGVTPSESPGPQVIANPVPGTGTSIGEEIQLLGGH